MKDFLKYLAIGGPMLAGMVCALYTIEVKLNPSNHEWFYNLSLRGQQHSLFDLACISVLLVMLGFEIDKKLKSLK